MQIPDTLYSLVDHGIIEEVVRPLMSGKEAQVYLVVSGGEQRVAKIYKEAQNRTFQKRAEYTEGRKVRNSRDQRAMSRGSRHGRAQNEAAWRSTEVDMIYRLRDAGVRVPTPHHFIDGVLIMELVQDAEGYPAPRLGDLTWEPSDAVALFDQLLREVVRMLCAGVVHGDLSDFNVLMAADGPVVIDFPQAVDASSNQNARKLLLRDVANLHRFAAKFAPEHAALPYAEEMWELYKRNALTPDVRLSGRYRAAHKPANTEAVLGLIGDAARDERRRRENMGLSLRGGPRDPAYSRDRSPTAAGAETQRRDARPTAGPARNEAGAARSEPRQERSQQHGQQRGAPNQRTNPREGQLRPEARGQQRGAQAERARGNSGGQREQSREQERPVARAETTRAADVPAQRRDAPRQDYGGSQTQRQNGDRTPVRDAHPRGGEREQRSSHQLERQHETSRNVDAHNRSATRESRVDAPRRNFDNREPRTDGARPSAPVHTRYSDGPLTSPDARERGEDAPRRNFDDRDQRNAGQRHNRDVREPRRELPRNAETRELRHTSAPRVEDTREQRGPSRTADVRARRDDGGRTSGEPRDLRSFGPRSSAEQLRGGNASGQRRPDSRERADERPRPSADGRERSGERPRPSVDGRERSGERPRPSVDTRDRGDDRTRHGANGRDERRDSLHGGADARDGRNAPSRETRDSGEPGRTRDESNVADVRKRRDERM